MINNTTVKCRAFDRLKVTGKAAEPLLSLNTVNIPVSTLDDVVTHFRGNMTAAARFLGIDRGVVNNAVKSRRLNVVMAFDAGDGKVIYKILK